MSKLKKLLKSTNVPDDTTPIPLGQVPEVVEELYGRHISRQAVYQWMRDGRKLKSGGIRALQVEKMDDGKIALKTGVQFGRYYTKVPWIKHFVEAT